MPVMSASMVRTSFTLPPDLNENLTYLSRRMGMSKSSLVSQLLADTVRDLRGLLEDIPENPEEGDFLRFRGASVDLIESRLDSVRRLGNDLFSQ